MKIKYSYKILISLITLASFSSFKSAIANNRNASFPRPAIYPSYNTSPKAPDSTGMKNNAVQLAAKIRLGWNIGNTFEDPGGETGWGSPVITEDYIKFVKQQGFNAIRLPCAWNLTHLADKDKARIDINWLNRVKEVIGYCVKNDMYVLLNIHWDEGWLENNCTTVKKSLLTPNKRRSRGKLQQRCAILMNI